MIPGTSFTGVAATLHDLLSTLLRPLETAALVQPDGTALFVHAGEAVDIATLPAAAHLCHRYLKLKPNDLALTNDPYSGGTHLGAFTLTLGVSLQPSGRDLDLLLSSRIEFAATLPAGRKIDDEGVRVPPMPLGHSGPDGVQINQDLLTAISHHPLAPAGLGAEIKARLAQMERVVKSLRRIAKDPGSPLRPANFAAYLEESGLVFDHLMSKLPLGTAQLSRKLPSGEMMKLQLKLTETVVLCDFAGTDPARDTAGTLAMTELQTFGACWAALVSPFSETLPMNAGSFQHLQVSAPSRTVVSAAAPLATARGTSEGAARIGRLTFDTLVKLQPSFRIAAGPEVSGRYEVVFEDGSRVSLSLAPGSGANAVGAGADATCTWSRRAIHASPRAHSGVRYLNAGVREGSGGAGVHRGGHGAKLAFEVSRAATFRWLDSSIGLRSEGLDGGRAGLAATIEIVRAGGEREVLTEALGQASLKAGDQVHLLSGGAGGYGEPKGEPAI